MVNYPKDWETKQVKDFGYVVTGNTPSTNVSEYWGRTYTWITPTDINNKIFISSSERRLTEKGYSVSRRLPSGSVLVTCIASIGKNCILHGQGSCNQQINAICINDKNYNLFIYYLMEFNKQHLENLAGITATKIIKKQIFENIKFIVPQLPEQQAIADALTTFDMHINNLAKLIEKKKMIRDGAVEDLVSGKRRLAGFSGKWEECELNKLADIFDGTHQTPKYTLTGVPFVSVENITNLYKTDKFINERDFELEFKNTPEKGDILMTRIGDIGTASIVTRKSKLAYYVSLALFKHIKIYSEFLLYYIHSSAFQKELFDRSLNFAIPKKINKGEIGKCNVHFPTDIVEQQAIADILTAMDKEISDLEKEKEKYIALKVGAMDDLLTGKIRLV